MSRRSRLLRAFLIALLALCLLGISWQSHQTRQADVAKARADALAQKAAADSLSQVASDNAMTLPNCLARPPLAPKEAIKLLEQENLGLQMQFGNAEAVDGETGQYWQSGRLRAVFTDRKNLSSFFAYLPAIFEDCLFWQSGHLQWIDEANNIPAHWRLEAVFGKRKVSALDLLHRPEADAPLSFNFLSFQKPVPDTTPVDSIKSARGASQGQHGVWVSRVPP